MALRDPAPLAAAVERGEAARATELGLDVVDLDEAEVDDGVDLYVSTPPPVDLARLLDETLGEPIPAYKLGRRSP